MLLLGNIALTVTVGLDATGALRLPVTVPTNIPVGDVFVQFLGLDSGAPNGLGSTSNGLKVTAH